MIGTYIQASRKGAWMIVAECRNQKSISLKSQLVHRQRSAENKRCVEVPHLVAPITPRALTSTRFCHFVDIPKGLFCHFVVWPGLYLVVVSAPFYTLHFTFYTRP